MPASSKMSSYHYDVGIPYFLVLIIGGIAFTQGSAIPNFPDVDFWGYTEREIGSALAAIGTVALVLNRWAKFSEDARNRRSSVDRTSRIEQKRREGTSINYDGPPRVISERRNPSSRSQSTQRRGR